MERGIRKKRRLVVFKPFLLPLGMFLGSYLPAAGQTPTPHVALAHEHVAPVIATLPMASISLPAATFLASRDLGKFNGHASLVFAGAYERDYTLEHLSPMDEVKTPTLTQSSLPLFRFWGGRLQLDAFYSKPHFQDVQLYPSGYGGIRGFRLPGQSYPGGPRSLGLSGFSLSFHFRRDAQAGHPAQLVRRMTRIVDSLLN
jgi:hypothetical protein